MKTLCKECIYKHTYEKVFSFSIISDSTIPPRRVSKMETCCTLNPKWVSITEDHFCWQGKKPYSDSDFICKAVNIKT